MAVICELRERGFSLQKIRRVIRFLQKELGKRLVETVRAASEYHLLTDGRHIFLEDSARGVVDLLKNARQPMLTVCLSDTVQRIRAGSRRLEKTKASLSVILCNSGARLHEAVQGRVYPAKEGT